MRPKVQVKAQMELDQIIGGSRLPEFGDYDSLSYIRAVLLEVLRWVPSGPLGVPHVAPTDDYFQGYFIPKGTMVIVVCDNHINLVAQCFP